jgi:flavin reductase (DIM6/NTAB) family NADH-FMN oxidoreductase RutF
VNVLSDTQEALSRRFSGVVDDRFAGLGYRLGEMGNPLLDDVLTWLECEVVQRYPAGDHTIIVGQVHDAGVRDGRPLLYYRGGYAQLER